MYFKFIRITNNERIFRDTTEGIWSGGVDSLFSKKCSPPYCCAVLLDPRMTDDARKHSRMETLQYLSSTHHTLLVMR